MIMKQELLKGLTEEQITKIRECKNQDEVLALAKEEGIELTDEQLAAISGGSCTSKPLACPRCGKTNVSIDKKYVPSMRTYKAFCKCNECSYEWINHI